MPRYEGAVRPWLHRRDPRSVHGATPEGRSPHSAAEGAGSVRRCGDRRRMDHQLPCPLIATADTALADELARLSAAAGATVETAATAGEVLRVWSTSPVVLI